MGIFWRLILAHLLADFTFQTDFIAKWKRKNIFGGLAHSFIFFVCASALCFGQLGQPWLLFGRYFHINCWAVLGVLSFFHFLEDEWRVRTIRKLVSADSFFFFLLDQCIHIALIFVFFPPQTYQLPEKWIIFAILFVLTTHFTSIFVYFTEKTVSGSSKLGIGERYFSMAERLTVGLALVLPGFWAFGVVAAWIPRLFIGRRYPEYRASRVNMIIGNSLAIFFGLIARAVYYG